MQGTSVTWPTLYDIGLLLIGIAVSVLFGCAMYVVGWMFGPKEPQDGE